MAREKKIIAPNEDGLYLSAEESALLLGIPETTFDDLVLEGIIPEGLKITAKTVRWDRDIILAVKVLLPFLLAKLRGRQE